MQIPLQLSRTSLSELDNNLHINSNVPSYQEGLDWVPVIRKTAKKFSRQALKLANSYC